MTIQEKILVIDDELGIRQGCQRVLEPQGFSVETAGTMQEGRQKILAEDYAMVLLDVMLPDGRGIELLTTIHERDPETVPVIITGYATVELAVAAIKQGAYDFISKPFPSDLLLLTVNQGLEKRRLSLETKRLQAIEEQAKEMTQAKEEMERLSAFKSKFTWIVAHELRSPVGAVQSLVRTLLRGLAGELNERQTDILSRIEARLVLFLDLINDLLALATSKTITPEEPLQDVSLQPLIHQLIDRFSNEAEKKQIQLELQLPEPGLYLRATQDGIEKILGNLLDNALKYTRKGGCIRISAVENAKQTRITVSDSGMGIPKEAVQHLGEEFFRAENVRLASIQGTGLGLSIVKQFVDRFEGTMQVQSEEGKGTTFTLAFPRWDIYLAKERQSPPTNFK